MGCGSSTDETSQRASPTTQKHSQATDPMSPEVIIAAFKQFDQNGDGVISIQEVKSAFAKMNVPCDDVVIYRFMREVDIDNDGQIDIEEFALWWIREGMKERPAPTMDELVAMFHDIDRDGKGFITTTDLKVMMLERKGYYTDENIEAIMRAADTDGDGRINLAEFIRLMAKLIVCS